MFHRPKFSTRCLNNVLAGNFYDVNVLEKIKSTRFYYKNKQNLLHIVSNNAALIVQVR